MSERVLFHEYGTQLRVAADGSLILDVLCGRVGQFGVEFTLNEAERIEYRDHGDAFVIELAERVRLNWRPFIERGRAC